MPASARGPARRAGSPAAHDLRGAVRSLTRARGKARRRGPEPVDEDGLPLAPFDAYGHDLLWWMDRMIRSTHPFEARMALVWHDWFGTADVSDQRLSIGQAELCRAHASGSFLELLLEVTRDPAMLIWLSGIAVDRAAQVAAELSPRTCRAPGAARRVRACPCQTGRT